MTPRTPHDIHRAALTRWRNEYPDDASSQAYVDAEILALEGDRSTARRPARWIATLLEYEAFTHTHGRTPREKPGTNTPLTQVERRLAEWARYLRRFEENLSDYQVARLEESPAFVWDLRNSAWGNTFERCTTFANEHGRLPHLNQANTTEFALARWLRRQLHHQHTGSADRARVSQIEALLQRCGRAGG